MNIKKKLSQFKRYFIRKIQKLQGKQFIHFLHIGKTGGSAVKHYMKHHSADSQYVIYLQQHLVKLKDIPEGESVIFFLREPKSRFVSGFYSRQRQGRPRYFNPWTKGEQKAFETFQTPNELACAIYSPDEKLRNKAQDAMKSIQHVRESYWDWFENSNYFNSRLPDIFFIGFQEDLAEHFNILKEKLGFPEETTLPNDDVHAHKNPLSFDKTLTDEAITNLKRWYKKDFEFIALCKDFIHNSPNLKLQ